MSDLSDRIASEHQPVWSGIVDDEDVYICHCQDEDDRTFAAHLAHIAELTEQAARVKITAEIAQLAHSRDDLMRLVRDGTSTDWVTGWDGATIAASQIARGEA